MKPVTRILATALAASAFAFAGPAIAQQQSTPAPVPHVTAPLAPTEAAPAAEGPALWQVADEDTTIYLFGTVHALPEGVDWLNGDIADALASSQTLVTEITLDDSIAAEMQQLVLSKGILPQGTSLRDMLDTQQKATFEGAMQKVGLPVAAFDQFEPWYAGMMMGLLPLLQQGYSRDAGVEAVLAAKAGELDRGSLETLEFQMGLFDGLPQESQIAFLIDAAENVDEIKGQLDAMVAEWLEGDADGLAALINEGLTDEVLAEQLLYMRNRNWATWIDDRLDAPGTVFVAVGAGHLAGEESVQDALEDLGIETTRIQ